jgi:hypothetical protein
MYIKFLIKEKTKMKNQKLKSLEIQIFPEFKSILA